MEINTALILLGGFTALRFLVRFMYESLDGIMRMSFARIGTLRFTEGDIFQYAGDLAIRMGIVLFPFMLIIAFSAIVASLLQVGFMQSWSVIKPQFQRVNPLKGFTRIFSYRMFAELAKSTLKVAIAGLVAYAIIRGALREIMLTIDMEPAQTVSLASKWVYRIGMRLGLAFIALAVLDYFYQRYEFEKSLRMTRQEIKEEFIRYEGRPEVRSRIKTVQRQLAMRRMMQEVPNADVVLTNPTHLAVAIRYNPKEMNAPKVVAKGARLTAQRIIAIAKEHRVPVVENKPLARALFKSVDIGEFIPLNLYQAVADILAYLWRMGKLKVKFA